MHFTRQPPNKVRLMCTSQNSAQKVPTPMLGFIILLNLCQYCKWKTSICCPNLMFSVRESGFEFFSQLYFFCSCNWIKLADSWKWEGEVVEIKCLRDRGLGGFLSRWRPSSHLCARPAGILLHNACEVCLSACRTMESSRCQCSVIPWKASLSSHKASHLTHVRGPGLAQSHTAEMTGQ